MVVVIVVVVEGNFFVVPVGAVSCSAVSEDAGGMRSFLLQP